MKYPQLVSMPSAVSDWLEEQLEARGIDAVLYTRYILSLLHSDTVDVIYSDEDLHFSHLKKEVRRSGGSRKRFRRSSDWWRHAQADAEKLKRSAAVECLMSASEQSCGIESLVDELCEKLNEIESDVPPPGRDSPVKKPTSATASPQELANRYYAAFPPLTRSSSPSRLISLIPKWIPSPKKKVHPQRKDAMKASRTVGKQRFGQYFKAAKKDTSWSSAKKLKAEVVPTPDEENNQWNAEDDMNMYDDLPVDVNGLLDDSPTPHDYTVEMMNMANMRDTGRRDFIRSGTNITSSIWSNEAAIEDGARVGLGDGFSADESVLDLQFSSITIDNRPDWSYQGDFAFTESNNFFDEPTWDYTLRPAQWSTPDEEPSTSEPDKNNLRESYRALNHGTEASAFKEVKSSGRGTKIFKNPFSDLIEASLQRSDKTVDLDKEKDDLLTSIRSHFRPINQKTENLIQGEYADGATFAVSNSWDHINYKRTESGALYMETDYAMRKKYVEYKNPSSTSVDFMLKYLVCQNDKACQTDLLDAEVEAVTLHQRLRDERRDAAKMRGRCTCKTTAMNTVYAFGRGCPVHGSIEEFLAQQKRSCDRCNNNKTVWDSNVIVNFKSGDQEMAGQATKSIWSGGDVCLQCLGRPPSTLQHTKLRQDVSQDGDQLLSDLSTIQKTYMEDLPPSELSCDLAGIIAPIKERKRRHSLMTMNVQPGETWSFASRLEEDCLIQMSTLPTLRSVTL